jgi:outer membrane protein assembly factor BamB
MTMMRSRLIVLAAAAAAAVALDTNAGAEQSADAARYWGQWRGPDATGVSKTANPPTQWSETSNVRWKVPIAGRGSGTPVVWGDRVFVTSAVPVPAATSAPRIFRPWVEAEAPGAQQGQGRGGRGGGRGGGQQLVPHRFVVMAIDRRTGKTVWERTAREEAPHEATHPENGTWASASAIVDGQHVIASFESRGFYAYDMNGKLVWEKDLGDKRMRNTFGEGSTPALHGNTLVVVWDHQGESFIAALDKRNGNELWRKPRKEIDTWATPLIVNVGGKPQAIVGAMNQIIAYDLATGDIVWQSAGLTMNPIPSPVSDGTLAILMSGYRGNALKAIRLAGAKGDITGNGAIVWSMDRETPYVPSPLLYDGILYFLKSNNGLLSAVDAATGKPHYIANRIDAVPNVFASPVGAAGRVYIPGREGATVVLKHGPTLEIIATNTLDDGFDASPALVDGEIYLRGYRNLYCIAAK